MRNPKKFGIYDSKPKRKSNKQSSIPKKKLSRSSNKSKSKGKSIKSISSFDINDRKYVHKNKNKKRKNTKKYSVRVNQNTSDLLDSGIKKKQEVGGIWNNNDDDFVYDFTPQSMGYDRVRSSITNVNDNNVNDIINNVFSNNVSNSDTSDFDSDFNQIEGQGEKSLPLVENYVVKSIEHDYEKLIEKINGNNNNVNLSTTDDGFEQLIRNSLSNKTNNTMIKKKTNIKSLPLMSTDDGMDKLINDILSNDIPIENEKNNIEFKIDPITPSSSINNKLINTPYLPKDPSLNELNEIELEPTPEPGSNISTKLKHNNSNGSNSGGSSNGSRTPTERYSISEDSEGFDFITPGHYNQSEKSSDIIAFNLNLSGNNNNNNNNITPIKPPLRNGTKKQNGSNYQPFPDNKNGKSPINKYNSSNFNNISNIEGLSKQQTYIGMPSEGIINNYNNKSKYNSKILSRDIFLEDAYSNVVNSVNDYNNIEKVGIFNEGYNNISETRPKSKSSKKKSKSKPKSFNGKKKYKTDRKKNKSNKTKSIRNNRL